jgi:hypothetical protein
MVRIALSIACVLFSACAASVGESALADPPLAAPVIATLQLRDRQLTISSTSSGIRYDVAEPSGIRSQLTLDELEAFAPELAELVRTASARLGSEPDARLDARPAMDPGVVPWAGRAGR